MRQRWPICLRKSGPSAVELYRDRFPPRAIYSDRSVDLSAGVSDYETLAAPTVIRLGLIMVAEHVG